ncbi:Histidine kinase-, DNA gyrase B-, and HSP90-like ATPase [Nonomuraea solani]|uniref:histidine kinase n=1 Tax=Nonomuraea solani TaxID=1144553 RepID=A0A1H6EQ98_9ACTN|nr:histidine kinase [Nonomuraea solani]SEG99992.1 Histidine kinase-, DNA gyrase B-, and HSP90-like ATPase [Nonomuraea solani]
MQEWLIAALGPACGAAGWLAVALVRTRRRYRAALAEQGRLLERERERAARSAVDAERARIAAELHDIVSHNVSLMVVQAGAAREVLPTMPGTAETALKAVEAAGRDAMTELRHLLGLLAPAQDGTDPPAGDDLAPQPGLGQLGALADRIAFAGLPVEVRISGEPRPVPAGVDVTAYRIVQEALTNALKHGDGGEAAVTVRYTDQYLRVEVLNTGPSVLTGAALAPRGGLFGDERAPRGRSDGLSGGSPDGGEVPARGAGRGLLGLRERVAVYGGDLDARRRLGGGFRVRARIPLERP